MAHFFCYMIIFRSLWVLKEIEKKKFWNFENSGYFSKNWWFLSQLWTVIENFPAVEISSFLVWSLPKGGTFVWWNKIFAHSARWPEISCQSQPFFKPFFYQNGHLEASEPKMLLQCPPVKSDFKRGHWSDIFPSDASKQLFSEF